jgi:DNA-binding CsgD family transcriptional regulator
MPSRAATVRNQLPAPTHLGPPRLVGREEQTRQLTATLARPPAVVLVEGEAGIGKTRLVTEYLATAPAGRCMVLVASCPPFRQPLTLGPVTDALRQAAPDLRGLDLSPLAGVLRPLFPEWADALPPAPEPLEDATAVRHRLYTALAGFLDHLAVSLLVVEDAHWADEATLEFLLFLTARHPQPLSLLVTYRPEDIPSGSLLRRLSSRLPAGTASARITLGALDVTATAALVSSMLDGKPVSGEFATFLHEHAEGLPLAVEETIRLLADRADLEFRAGGWMRRRLGAIEVPPTVRDAVLERAERLEARAQAVLQAAAVLGIPADERVLRMVSGLDGEDWQGGLAGALGCGLLTENILPNGSALVSFRHGLTGRAVYETLTARHRRQLHLRAGQVLEHQSPPPEADLARHFRLAGDADSWRSHAEQAADLAFAAGDYSACAELLRDVITETRLPPAEAARLVEKVPQTVLRPSDVSRLAQALRAALDSGAATAQEEAEVRCQLGMTLVVAEEWDNARAELERALPHLSHDPSAAVKAMSLLGWPIGWADWPASEHLRWLRRAAEVKAAMPPPAELDMLINRVTALLMLGEDDGWAEAATIPDDSPVAWERLRILRAHGNIGQAAVLWGRYAEARRRLDQARDLSEAHGHLLYREEALAICAHLDWFHGAWDGLAVKAGQISANEALPPLTRLKAELVCGQLEAATRGAMSGKLLERVITRARRYGSMEDFMEASGTLARLHVTDGRWHEALAVTAEPAEIVSRKGIWLWATAFAPARMSALLAEAHAGEAADLMTAFAHGLRGRAAPAPKAALATCRALLAGYRGEHERAATLFGWAASAWLALPRPYDALLAREQQGCCLLAADQGQVALGLLEQAHQGLSGLGATSDAGRVGRLLRDHGVKVAGRAGRRSYGDQLSPREIEVVRLVVDGRTNREIADSLFLSVPTVVHHLASARRKLKAPSRTALAVTAVENGLLASDQ